ncbi:MAG TPA: DUF1569 domain-containing protein [Candidatus Dormibacteraeota bacterium]|nr:DUF1569 domain-containing protein [Candidatus Dormibacteraeota bacterium]
MKTLRKLSNKAEILRRLETLQPTSQRRWGSMSAHNMICHLSDGFRLYMGDRPAKPAPLPAPRLLLKWVALWAPIPWPHGFKTMPEIDQDAGGTRPTKFARDMLELCQLIERFTQPPGRFCAEGHPHFGRLSEKEWMRLAYLHADHHLRQFGA